MDLCQLVRSNPSLVPLLDGWLKTQFNPESIELLPDATVHWNPRFANTSMDIYWCVHQIVEHLNGKGPVREHVGCPCPHTYYP